MEKRKLSAIPRPIATPEMMEVADRLGGMRHIVTAELIDDKKILLLILRENETWLRTGWSTLTGAKI